MRLSAELRRDEEPIGSGFPAWLWKGSTPARNDEGGTRDEKDTDGEDGLAIGTIGVAEVGDRGKSCALYGDSQCSWESGRLERRVLPVRRWLGGALSESELSRLEKLPLSPTRNEGRGGVKSADMVGVGRRWMVVRREFRLHIQAEKNKEFIIVRVMTDGRKSSCCDKANVHPDIEPGKA